MRLGRTLGVTIIALGILTACGGSGGNGTDSPGDGHTAHVQAYDKQDYNAYGFAADAGEVNFDFNLEETEDLANWATVINGIWSFGGGGVGLAVPLAGDKRFYRVVVEFE